jgi:outer membrane lipoprotein carrier protein
MMLQGETLRRITPMNNEQKSFPARLIGFAAVFCLFFLWSRPGLALDPKTIVEGMQRRYASVTVIKANFEQTYKAPGIEQVESGVFWLKKPGLMRWEYQKPEAKLFIADGTETFLYVPKDKQVTVQPFSVSDMHGTPLKFLLGASDLLKSYDVSFESEFKAKFANTVLVRLKPRKTESNFAFFVLELNRDNYEIQSFIMREHSGDTSRFVFTGIVTNVKVNDKSFRFKTPKGVEEVRYTDEQ